MPRVGVHIYAVQHRFESMTETSNLQEKEGIALDGSFSANGRQGFDKV